MINMLFLGYHYNNLILKNHEDDVFIRENKISKTKWNKKIPIILKISQRKNIFANDYSTKYATVKLIESGQHPYIVSKLIIKTLQN